MKNFQYAVALVATLSPFAVYAQSSSCAAPSPSGSIQPSVASGYRLQVVATGLAKPRGILFDTAGNLLVVESGAGSISAHSLDDTNGCVTVSNTRNVTGADLLLNHGIEISPDGNTLYASSTDNVYQWDYDASARSISNQVTLISNMSGTDHTTRTLLLSRQVPGMLVVARGSTSNIDIEAASLSSGHSQVKAFDLTNRSSEVYQYDTAGLRLGWGLRNEVGIGEHPNSGGIWGVENSADQLTRMGVDIHQDNPAEELNFLGYLNGSSDPQQGSNFGYPWCFTAWDPSILPNNSNITVGQQFAIDASADSDNMNKTDAYCAQQTAPRLSFQAHMAPLDIKFNNSGQQAWITFHGSWDRTDPVGYKLSVVNFTSAGEPTAPSDSVTAAVDVISNADNAVCPDNCFRPVGMAIDQQGRIFMSSDASGEIYMVTRDAGTPATPSSSGTTTTSGGSTSTANAAPPISRGVDALKAGILSSVLMMLV